MSEPVAAVANSDCDGVLAAAAAVDLAHAAAIEVGGDSVGAHAGARGEGERVVTHAFAATLPGYRGWYWAVTLARPPRGRTATVDEVVLLPGEDALRAPEWVPWQERLRPGDLGPGDLLPSEPGDYRLVPGYLAGADDRDDGTDSDDDVLAFELGLGRERVMSRDGRLDAAERWYAGEGGPDTAMARQAPARCGTCGFLLPLAGSLRAGFGACGNEMAPDDGRVVSVEHGCGAHSQVVVTVPPLGEPSGEVFDDGDEITS